TSLASPGPKAPAEGAWVGPFGSHERRSAVPPGSEGIVQTCSAPSSVPVATLDPSGLKQQKCTLVLPASASLVRSSPWRVRSWITIVPSPNSAATSEPFGLGVIISALPKAEHCAFWTSSSSASVSQMWLVPETSLVITRRPSPVKEALITLEA